MAGWQGEVAEVRVSGRYIADDITLVLAHRKPEVLTAAAVRFATFPDGKLKQLGLTQGSPKCRNLAISPGRILGYVFRQQAGHAMSYRRDLKKNDELKERRACTTELAGDVPQDVFPVVMRSSLPYVYSDPLRILGVLWDGRLSFMDHIKGALDRAGERHGVMARLARSTWGLEVGVLRSTHAAPLTSLSGYGLALVGPGRMSRDGVSTRYSWWMSRRVELPALVGLQG